MARRERAKKPIEEHDYQCNSPNPRTCKCDFRCHDCDGHLILGDLFLRVDEKAENGLYVVHPVHLICALDEIPETYADKRPLVLVETKGILFVGTEEHPPADLIDEVVLKVRGLRDLLVGYMGLGRTFDTIIFDQWLDVYRLTHKYSKSIGSLALCVTAGSRFAKG